jgi:hypothetical protein
VYEISEDFGDVRADVPQGGVGQVSGSGGCRGVGVQACGSGLDSGKVAMRRGDRERSDVALQTCCGGCVRAARMVAAAPGDQQCRGGERDSAWPFH